jgi:hypothetical protein
MNSLLHDFFAQVPWLKPALIWCVALLIILTLLAGPAYFLLPFVTRIRAELRAYLENLRARQSDARATREAACQRLAADCQRQRSLRQLAVRGAFLQSALNATLKSLNKLAKALRKATRKFGGLTRAVTRLRHRLREPSSPAFPEMPAAEGLRDEVAAARSARDKVVICSLLLVALAPFNTGMLSRIFQDVFAVSLVVLHIPLYITFALVITVVEAGTGFVYSMYANGHGRRWPAWVAVGALLVLASAEGFFFSLVAPEAEQLIELLQIKRRTLFFLYGSVPPAILFLLGLTWHDAWDAARRGSTVASMKRMLHKLRNDQEAYSDSIRSTGEGYRSATARAQEAGRALAGDDAAAETITSVVQQLHDQIEQMRTQPPQWARAEEQELSVGDVHHLADQAGVWIIFALLAAGCLICIAYETVWSLVAGLPPWDYLAVGAGLAVWFAGAGLLFGSNQVIVGRAGSEDVAISAPLWSRTLSYVMIALGSAFHLYGLLQLALPGYQVVLWLGSLLLGLFLFAAACHLGPLLTVARVLLRRAGNVAAAAAERLYLLTATFVAAVVTAVEYVFALLAAPIYALRKQPIPLVGAVRTAGSSEGPAARAAGEQ